MHQWAKMLVQPLAAGRGDGVRPGVGRGGGASSSPIGSPISSQTESSANGSAYFYDDWCPCGNAGTVAPAVAINTLPTTSGATCKTFNGGSQPSNNGFTTCTLAQLGVSTPAGASSPPPPLPPMASGACGLQPAAMVLALASGLAALML